MPAAWLVIVLLFWVVSTVSKAKKNADNQQRQKAAQQKSRQETANRYARQQTRPVEQPRTPAAPAMSRRDDWDDEEDTWDQRDAQRPQAAQAPQAAPAMHHQARPLEAHMHTPVMGAEGEGTEGIDCCHEFMLDQPPEEPAEFLPLQEETENERAKALLQGVIYSEILGRRPLRRYGGKRPAA